MSKRPKTFERAQSAILADRLREPRRFVQVVEGPRQVGKTTLVNQVIEQLGIAAVVESADQPSLRGEAWIDVQWERARALAAEGEAVLVLDEIQKVSNWSEAVKRLWDADTKTKLPLKVVLLGSSPLLVQKGLTESLAGRFESIRLPHWTFAEMREAFGFSLDEFVYFGGYPGAASLIGDESRWAAYIRDSLIETTIARDVLLHTRVDKPALLRRLFELGTGYSGQILSYTKLLGQLDDAGNTTTLAHYLELLSAAGMLTGLQKYSGGMVRRRSSSPKFQVLNTALMSALESGGFEQIRNDPARWGRLVESAVGAHLVGSAEATGVYVNYWRDGDKEVDFVVSRDSELIAIEVKSGERSGPLNGLDAFRRRFPEARPIIVGANGVPLADFLSRPA